MAGSVERGVLLLLLASELVHCLGDGSGGQRHPRLVPVRNRQRKLDYPLKVRTTKNLPQREGTRYRCKVATTGVLGVRDGRLVRSRALAYATDTGAGVKTLICRAETTDVTVRSGGAFRRKSVAGVHVVTTGRGDPLPLLDSGARESSGEDVVVGSEAGSALGASSTVNRSVSAVETRDAGAEALTRSRTEVVASEAEGARSGLESSAEAEGSADLGVVGRGVVLTGEEEEESSLVVARGGGEEEQAEGSIATVIDHNKVTDFDIAFRHVFNV